MKLRTMPSVRYTSMYDWEAKLIEVLNEEDPHWRDYFDDPEAAARVLLPEYPGLPSPLDPDEYDMFGELHFGDPDDE